MLIAGKDEGMRGQGLEEVKLEISLPAELVDRMDKILEVLGFQSREELVTAAVRRLVDRYVSLAVRGR